MYFILHNDGSAELYHHGIRGMKWGVRRYQNKDGSLTLAGRKRYDQNTSEGLAEDNIKKTNQSSAKSINKEYFEQAKKLSDSTKDLTRTLNNINNKSIKKHKTERLDLSSMSDKELRDQINRAVLEKQYNDMFAPRNISKGREYLGNFLETAGDVASVGSSALAIYLAIKKLSS